MPRKVGKRKRVLKKQVANRKVARRSASMFTRAILPGRLFTKLKYVSNQIGSTTTVSLGYNQFGANALYDPNLTGVGHQPYGFDQLSAIYNDYRVHGCYVKVIGRMLTSGTSGVVSIHHNGSSAVPASLQDMMESVKSKYIITGYTDPFVITKYIDIAKLFGKSKVVIRAEDGYSAGIGANPTNLAYANVMWQNLDESTSTGWNIRVELTYMCEFNDLKVLAGS